MYFLKHITKPLTPWHTSLFCLLITQNSINKPFPEANICQLVKTSPTVVLPKLHWPVIKSQQPHLFWTSWIQFISSRSAQFESILKFSSHLQLSLPSGLLTVLETKFSHTDTKTLATFPRLPAEVSGIRHSAVSVHVCCSQNKFLGSVSGATLRQPV
jgi:hypothetical protein